MNAPDKSGGFTYELLINVPPGWSAEQAAMMGARLHKELAPGCFMFLSAYDGEVAQKIDAWPEIPE